MVTVEELLAMTSGLSDFNDNKEGKSELMKKSEWSPSDLIKLIQACDLVAFLRVGVIMNIFHGHVEAQRENLHVKSINH